MPIDEGPPPEDDRPPVDTPPPRPPPEKKAEPMKTSSSAPPEDEEADAPPSDLLAERCVIGCATMDADACGIIRGALEPADFYLQAHQRIAKAIWKIADDGHPVDVATVCGELKHGKHLEQLGGLSYLMVCEDAVPTTAHAARYAEIVKGKAVQRQVIEAADRIGKLARDNGKPPAEMLAEVKGMLEGIEVGEKRVAIASAAVMAETLGETEWLWFQWIPVGHVTAICGDPGAQKSALALWIAAQLGKGGKWPDGADMGADTQALWLDAEQMQKPNVNRLRDWGFGLEAQWIHWAGEDGLEEVNLSEPGTFTAYAQSAVAQGCQLVVIDSWQFCHSFDENDSKNQKILLNEIKGAARTYNLAVLIIHHPRKQRESETEKITLERMKGSSVVAALCRSVWGVWRPDPSVETARVEVIKLNLEEKPEAFGFSWESEPSRLEFGPAPEEERKVTVVDQAADFLRDALANKPLEWQGLLKLGGSKGHSQDALYKAKKRLRCPTVDIGGQQCWSLPAPRSGN